MLNLIFKPSIENSNVKQLVNHMLSKMDFGKYQKFLHNVARYPEQNHKFVVFEYVQSPNDTLITRSERLPGSKMSIHNIIQNPDFDKHMTCLFGKPDRVLWYTRRKMDYTLPFEEQLSDTRQLVVLNKQELDEDYSDMPSLIPTGNDSYLRFNPEDYYIPPLIPTENVSYPILNPEDDMPSLVPLSYTHISGINQTIWSPCNYTYLSPTMHALS